MFRKIATTFAGIGLIAGTAVTLAAAPAYASSDASYSPPPAVVYNTPAEADAANYEENLLGSTTYDGLCQGLQDDAWSSGGVSLSSEGNTSSAISFWQSYSGTEYPVSENPPAGALVFWGATSSNPYGHVALSVGNGTAISSEERDNTGVHTFSIAARDSDGYQDLGYLIPG